MQPGLHGRARQILIIAELVSCCTIWLSGKPWPASQGWVRSLHHVPADHCLSCWCQKHMSKCLLLVVSHSFQRPQPCGCQVSTSAISWSEPPHVHSVGIAVVTEAAICPVLLLSLGRHARSQPVPHQVTHLCGESSASTVTWCGLAGEQG